MIGSHVPYLRVWVLAVSVSICLPAGGLAVERPLAEIVDEAQVFAVQQFEGMLKALEQDQRLPRTFSNGRLVLAGPQDWTSGFFPGSLWLIAEQTGDVRWRKAAADFTRRVESVKTYGGTQRPGLHALLQLWQRLSLYE